MRRPKFLIYRWKTDRPEHSLHDQVWKKGRTLQLWACKLPEDNDCKHDSLVLTNLLGNIMKAYLSLTHITWNSSKSIGGKPIARKLAKHTRKSVSLERGHEILPSSILRWEVATKGRWRTVWFVFMFVESHLLQSPHLGVG